MADSTEWAQNIFLDILDLLKHFGQEECNIHPLWKELLNKQMNADPLFVTKSGKKLGVFGLLGY